MRSPGNDSFVYSLFSLFLRLFIDGADTFIPNVHNSFREKVASKDPLSYDFSQTVMLDSSNNQV